jgi:hypothetical protein
MLPEIKPQQRAFSSFSFPASAMGRPIPGGFAAEREDVKAPQLAVRGNPLAEASEEGKRPDTMYTVYDPEEAYGGI